MHGAFLTRFVSDFTKRNRRGSIRRKLSDQILRDWINKKLDDIFPSADGVVSKPKADDGVIAAENPRSFAMAPGSNERKAKPNFFGYHPLAPDTRFSPSMCQFP